MSQDDLDLIESEVKFEGFNINLHSSRVLKIGDVFRNNVYVGNVKLDTIKHPGRNSNRVISSNGVSCCLLDRKTTRYKCRKGFINIINGSVHTSMSSNDIYGTLVNTLIKSDFYTENCNYEIVTDTIDIIGTWAVSTGKSCVLTVFELEHGFEYIHKGPWGAVFKSEPDKMMSRVFQTYTLDSERIKRTMNNELKRKRCMENCIRALILSPLLFFIYLIYHTIKEYL